MNKLFSIMDNFDDADDYMQAVVGIFAFSLGIVSPLVMYLNDNLAHYALLAALSILGQTAMYFAKFRFPNYFGKHDKKLTLGTKVLYYFIDCFLASLFGILGYEYVVNLIFGEGSLKQVVISVVLIGAFYETLLKKVLKKNKEISNSDSEEFSAKTQSIVGDGEEEGIDQSGTPVPIKLPPNPNQ